MTASTLDPAASAAPARLAPAHAAPAAVRLAGFHVAGIRVRTCNRDEMNPAIAQLGGLWNRFFSESWERRLPGRGDDGRIYGVYSGYESDQHGAFDVTAGVALAEAAAAPVEQVAPGAVSVAIEPGDYLVFRGQGEMPQMVIDTWLRVWEYFAQNPQLRRRFGTDFEAYAGPDQVAVHIGVML